MSSAVQNNPGYGVGYADAADPGNPAGLPSGTIEIKYTLLGDADLNGVVNGVDYGIVAANFNKGVTAWDQGDFDYNGIVNGIDFGELAANFNKGSNAPAAAMPVTTFAAVTSSPVVNATQLNRNQKTNVTAAVLHAEQKAAQKSPPLGEASANNRPMSPFGAKVFGGLKYIVLAALIISGAAVLAFGPRGGEDLPRNFVIVDYWEKWTGEEEAAMRKIVDDFNSTVGRDQQIYVRYLSTSAVEQKTLVATAAGIPPDVAGLYNQDVPQFCAHEFPPAARRSRRRAPHHRRSI